MAVTTQVLKNNTFLLLDDVKDHCGIPLTNTEHDNRLIRLINMVTDMAEKYIEGPILTREFTEVCDGDASNTIVPAHYPVRSISEVRIDYNGDFSTPTTVIDASGYLIRGIPDLALGVRGTDICIRNDGNTSVIGRLFIGSVVGSIQIKYKAGYGETSDEIPEDLKYAVLMGVEYFYLLRENRLLNVSSRTNNNQGYSRDKGLPVEVKDILDQYKDYSLGRTNRPQKNTFTI
jgi:hypothetical protein